MATAAPKQLYEPCPRCGGLHPTDAADIPPEVTRKVNREISRIVKEVWDGSASNIDQKLHVITGRLLESNVINGFKQDWLGVDFDTPDAAMLTRLTRDTWQFAGAKTYQNLRDMTLALKGDDGKLRSYQDFREEAFKISGKYNEAWLKTEYNQAAGAATMASRWNEFSKNSEDMPYLQYVTVGDNNVRDSHALLNGIIKKMIDDFWRTHFPPNGWGCRCDAEQLATGVATESENVPDVPVPEMFRTNLAVTGNIYPPKHPFYEGVPDDVLRQSVASLPDSVAYKRIYETDEGGFVDLHMYHGIGEMAANIRTAKILANAGHKVKLLPILKSTEDDLRKQLFGKQYKPGKNADAFVDGKMVELKQPKAVTKSAIHNGIGEGKDQAGIVGFEMPINSDLTELKRFAKGKLKVSGADVELWAIDQNGNIEVITRQMLGLK